MSDDVSRYVDENGDRLRRVIRNSESTYARACAWAILDVGGDGPETEQLRRELEQVGDGPGG